MRIPCDNESDTAHKMLLLKERPGEGFLYNFYTAFVTISVLVFIAIYNTPFITVVTLGGAVLGSALIGFCSVLLVFLLRKLLRNRIVRCVSGIAGCAGIVGATAYCLPGWEIRQNMATVLFLLALCFLVTEINEYTLNEERKENPG